MEGPRRVWIAFVCELCGDGDDVSVRACVSGARGDVDVSVRLCPWLYVTRYRDDCRRVKFQCATLRFDDDDGDDDDLQKAKYDARSGSALRQRTCFERWDAGWCLIRAGAIKIWLLSPQVLLVSECLDICVYPSTLCIFKQREDSCEDRHMLRLDQWNVWSVMAAPCSQDRLLPSTIMMIYLRDYLVWRKLLPDGMENAFAKDNVCDSILKDS